MAPVHIPILAFLFGFFIIAWLGAMMCRPLMRIRPKPEHLVVGATTAIAAYALYMTLVGMIGGLGKAFHYTIGAFIVVGLWYINYMMRWDGRQRPKLDWEWWRPPDTPTWIIFWLLVVFQLVMFVNALAPFINPDAEHSHYLFVSSYIESGRITIDPQNAFSYYPQAIEMAVLTAFSRAGEYGPDAANLCFWFMQLLLVGWLIDFCARRDKQRVGYLLAAAVCGLFYWPVIAYSGYADGAVALFSVAGVFCYLDWIERRGKPIEEKPPPKLKHLTIFWRWQQVGFTRLALCGFFIGTACVAKYSALFVAVLVFLHLLWILIADSLTRKRTWAAFLGFLVFFLIAVLPFYGRNLLVTGNPVFPFMRGLFGGPELTLADDVSTWTGWGIPITFRNYIIYPFRLAWFYPLGVNWFRVPYMYMTWLFALAPIAGVLLLHRRLARIVAIWCFVFFSFAFFVMNLQTRYFLTFTILALWLVVEWLETFCPSARSVQATGEGAADTRRKPTLAKWIVFLIVLVPFATQLDLARNHFIQRAPYLFGGMSRNEYIAHVWPSFEVFQAANELGDEQNRVMIFSHRTYYLTAPYVKPSAETISIDASSEGMLNDLAANNVRYLLMESRIRRAGALIDWCLENGDASEGEMTFDEDRLLEEVGQRDVSRDLARELLQHRGGVRFTGDDGRWRWKIDLDNFRKPELRAILRLLAEIKGFESEGLLSPVKVYGEWELYEIAGI